MFSFLSCLYAPLTSIVLTFYTTFTDLDLAWGSQGQCKAKHNGFIFSHTFHLIRMKFIVVMKQFKLNVLRLFLTKVYEKGGKYCFTDCVKKLTRWHVFGRLRIDLIQTWSDDRLYCTLQFDTSLIDIGLDSKSQGVIK